MRKVVLLGVIVLAVLLRVGASVPAVETQVQGALRLLLLVVAGVLILGFLVIAGIIALARRLEYRASEPETVEQAELPLVPIKYHAWLDEQYDEWLDDFPLAKSALSPLEAERRGTYYQLMVREMAGIEFDECVYYTQRDVFLLFVDSSRLPLEAGVRRLVAQPMMDDLSTVLQARVERVPHRLVYAIGQPAGVTTNRLPVSVALDLDAVPTGHVPFGVTERGNKFVPWAAIPHVLVTGETQHGKTNFVKGVVAAALRDGLQVYIIDTSSKRGAAYRQFKTKCTGWAESAEDALGLLHKLRRECRLRSNAFIQYHVERLDDYNELVPVAARKPEVVVVIEEFADIGLATNYRDELKTEFIKLVSQSASFGVHVIAVAQYAKADVMPSLGATQLGLSVCFRAKTRPQAEANLGNVEVEWKRRATKLPVGRAIISHGIDTYECQTYQYIDDSRRGMASADDLLNDEIRLLTGLAIQHLDGNWNVNGLYRLVGPASEGGIAKSRISQYATRLEAMGLLTEYGHTSSGKTSRRVTDELADMAMADMRCQGLDKASGNGSAVIKPAGPGNGLSDA